MLTSYLNRPGIQSESAMSAYAHQQLRQQKLNQLKLNQDLDSLLSSATSLHATRQTLQTPASHNSSIQLNPLLPKRSEQIDMSDVIRQAAIQRALGGRVKMCTFCKTNGESYEIYTSHSLKDSTDKITCPILVRYACPVCGATGEQTHVSIFSAKLSIKLENLPFKL